MVTGVTLSHAHNDHLTLYIGCVALSGGGASLGGGAAVARVSQGQLVSLEGLWDERGGASWRPVSFSHSVTSRETHSSLCRGRGDQGGRHAPFPSLSYSFCGLSLYFLSEILIGVVTFALKKLSAGISAFSVKTASGSSACSRVTQCVAQCRRA